MAKKKVSDVEKNDQKKPEVSVEVKPLKENEAIKSIDKVEPVEEVIKPIEEAIKPVEEVVKPVGEVIKPVEDDETPLYPENGNQDILKILKVYSDQEKLYVGKYGQMYSPEHYTPQLNKDAKLYKNPFYKK